MGHCVGRDVTGDKVGLEVGERDGVVDGNCVVGFVEGCTVDGI